PARLQRSLNPPRREIRSNHATEVAMNEPMSQVDDPEDVLEDDDGDDDDDDYYYYDVDSLSSGNLADELAEHAMPSPVYQEDARYEMMAALSDWEYYSDDYWDDDPGLLGLVKGGIIDAAAKTKRTDVAALNAATVGASIKGTTWRED